MGDDLTARITAACAEIRSDIESALAGMMAALAESVPLGRVPPLTATRRTVNANAFTRIPCYDPNTTRGRQPMTSTDPLDLYNQAVDAARWLEDYPDSTDAYRFIEISQLLLLLGIELRIAAVRIEGHVQREAARR